MTSSRGSKELRKIISHHFLNNLENSCLHNSDKYCHRNNDKMKERIKEVKRK